VVHLGGEPNTLKGKGDCCIKTGFAKGGDTFVVKVAPGSFKINAKLGISGNTGCMMVYSQLTGRLEGLLLDEGILTELRTAAAGALAASLLGPKKVTGVAIIGTGVQARYQLRMLKAVTDCRVAFLFGRTKANALQCKKDIESWGDGWEVELCETVKQACASSNLIVTVTNSRKALVMAEDVSPGTHISAIGADGAGKQELDAKLISTAEVLVADSKSQCLAFGDLSRLSKKDQGRVVAIGDVLKDASHSFRRTSAEDSRISVFDATGVAIQDVVIASVVHAALSKTKAAREEFIKAKLAGT